MSEQRTEKELMEMQTLFDWALLQENAHPELRSMFHVSNEGKRSRSQGAKLRHGGLKKGVPDIWLPVAKNGYHGLVIELKVDRNKPTEDQKEWLMRMAKNGWKACCCWGFEAAATVIAEHIGINLYLMRSPERIQIWGSDGLAAERKG